MGGLLSRLGREADRHVGIGTLDVVGIGSMVVDRVHRCARILGDDEKGMLGSVAGAGPVRRAVGGVVLNHLGWARALGLRCGIFGRQGDDEDGRFLRAAMDRMEIERDIRIVAEASSLAEIFVDDAGGRAIYMAAGATSTTTVEHVREHADFIRRAARLSTEVSQLPLVATLAALEVAREASIPTVVDLDVPPSDALATLGVGGVAADQETLEAVLRAADLLKPSKSAASELVGAAGGGADALGLARALRERFGNRAVVMTDGEAGCAISAQGFEGFVPARAVKAVDTTGAGDAFLGGLITALQHGLAWEQAGALANACGAACVEQLGAFPENPGVARARVLEIYRGPSLALADGPGAAPATTAHAGLAALGIAAEEIASLRERHDGASLGQAAELIERARELGGRVHVTGIGKPEHVAHYAASVLSSTGVPATFLHATEAIHGSLGQLEPSDVLVAISNSGRTEELRRTIEGVEGRVLGLIAVTGGLDSWLAQHADVVLDAAVAREGGPLGLAPRASVAAEILVVAALSAELQARLGLTKAEYAARHPAGSLGKRARQ